MQIFNGLMKIFKNNLRSKPTCKMIFGFTLAEVLIVIGILGIIAEFTIPVLFRNVTNMQYQVAATKMQNALDTALISVRDDNGGDVSNLSWDQYYKALAPKFAYSDRADGAPSANPMCNGGNTYYPINSTISPAQQFSLYDCIKLKDGGYLMLIKQFNLVCNESNINFANCPSFLYDMNGLKPPNKLLQDITLFGIGNKRVYVNYSNPDLKVFVNGAWMSFSSEILPSSYVSY